MTEYVMVPKDVLDRVRNCLIGHPARADTLHDLESSSHITDMLPLDAVHEGMTADEFSRHFLKPAARAADRAGCQFAAVVCEMEDDEENGGRIQGRTASVIQREEGKHEREQIRTLLEEFAARIL